MFSGLFSKAINQDFYHVPVAVVSGIGGEDLTPSRHRSSRRELSPQSNLIFGKDDDIGEFPHDWQVAPIFLLDGDDHDKRSVAFRSLNRRPAGGSPASIQEAVSVKL